MPRPSFADRRQAGRALAERLGALDPASAIVLALPRGGVPVAFEIAAANACPLDLVLVRKIGVPGQRELALGAVVDGDAPVTVVNEEIARTLRFGPAEIEKLAARELEAIESLRARLMPGRAPLSVAGKTAIVVDDGIATGATARAALKALKQRGASRTVLAVPVAPPGVAAEFADTADETIVLVEPKPFNAVGSAYEDFSQVEDAEVIALLDQLRAQAPTKRG